MLRIQSLSKPVLDFMKSAFAVPDREKERARQAYLEKQYGSLLRQMDEYHKERRTLLIDNFRKSTWTPVAAGVALSALFLSAVGGVYYYKFHYNPASDTEQTYTLPLFEQNR